MVEGGTATEVEDPTKEGFTFDGWYIDEAGTTPFHFGNVIQENMTVYAMWTAVPAEPTPGPADPTPGPADPTPGPADPTPGPAGPTPEPTTPSPTPTTAPNGPVIPQPPTTGPTTISPAPTTTKALPRTGEANTNATTFAIIALLAATLLIGLKRYFVKRDEK